MNNFHLAVYASVLTGLWYFLFASPAHAYFDVGVGTYVIQIFFGFGAAFWFAAVSSLKKRWPGMRSSTEEGVKTPGQVETAPENS